MSNNNTSSSVIALSKSQRFKVQAGCVCLMIATSMVRLSLATIQAPILQKMDAMKYFSLLTIFSSLGISIMTPIGGKLSDLIGRKNIIIIAINYHFINKIHKSIKKNITFNRIFQYYI